MVDEWRLGLLRKTAKKNFGPYARYFTVAWINNITKGGPVPKYIQEWAETEEEK
jgi:hypothetical protein